MWLWEGQNGLLALVNFFFELGLPFRSYKLLRFRSRDLRFYSLLREVLPCFDCSVLVTCLCGDFAWLFIAFFRVPELLTL